jgi:hypothetical protein
MADHREMQQRLWRMSAAISRLVCRVSGWLHARSRALIAFLDVRMEALIAGWIGVTVLLGFARTEMASAQIANPAEALITLLPYLLIAFAPIVGYRVTAGSFPRGLLSAQPALRLCRYGAWRKLDPVSARKNRAFGPAGFMASLAAGILLNVPFRSFEFILAIPAIPPDAPGWAHSLTFAMTLDVVVMNFFYMVCFVMAMRSVPLFPRMLLFAWGMDIVMQLTIAHFLAERQDLPATVARALEYLLLGNLKKVLISAFIWLPYLILSDRVNVTFRQRVRV